MDWDGKIRMDPSSSYAMQRLIGLKDRYDVAFACDTDHDRHGIVTRSSGLLLPNHYLSVMIDYLFQHRPQWRADAAVGKTVVSTSADRSRGQAAAAASSTRCRLGSSGSSTACSMARSVLAARRARAHRFCAGMVRVWTTDKDGIAAALLSAEITARGGRDPGELYRDLVGELGQPLCRSRRSARQRRREKAALARLSPKQVQGKQLAGEPIEQVLDRAPGNGAAIGGIKVTSASGWFAARPSGTEDIYKIYAESFKDEAHLTSILQEAQQIVDAALKSS